ncbi:MAG: epoxyqueuosine reductase [Clostridia bacterium]|nr:epoxyqueuosine reductase [Clostridia bacterium]
MFAFLSNFLQKEQIELWGSLPLSSCHIVKPYLLERTEISDGTVILLAIPYYTHACDDPRRNLSAYAVSKDYHAFCRQFFEKLLIELRERFPSHRFSAFADHSPIDERDAAARAGLGVIGKNHLLLTEKYSSYVFFGELITDAKLPTKETEIGYCNACGLCQRNCPMNHGCPTCLSALTQKKGILTPEEEQNLLRYGSVWGCDLCQDVCPYTVRAKQEGSIYTPIAFFEEACTPVLTEKLISEMTEEEFSHRAYAWRGRDTVLRNLKLMNKHREEDPPC